MKKIEGLEWLDCVYNLIEYYDDGGRTAAFSDVVIEYPYTSDGQQSFGGKNDENCDCNWRLKGVWERCR